MGASLKDTGKKTFGIVRLEDPGIASSCPTVNVIPPTPAGGAAAAPAPAMRSMSTSNALATLETAALVPNRRHLAAGHDEMGDTPLATDEAVATHRRPPPSRT